ncbi:MAG: NAD(P)H-hydrate dehydratase [Tepidisphaera sp.]|nr:NAD(P)H-hydrate dehydratase [Tepidisphaera sp.]
MQHAPWEDGVRTLPPRTPGGHKGTFGTVTIVGGSVGHGRYMVGAPALVALGALRSGAGLAKIVASQEVLGHAMGVCPSATGISLPERAPGELEMAGAISVFDEQAGAAHALVVGPGMGVGDVERAMVLRGVQQDQVPVVVDADAITNLAEIPELWRDFRAGAILTPHPGEFARLAKTLRVTQSATDDATRPAAASALAQKLGCVVVLKGQGTVVSDGQRTWVCGRGHACLATAGTGDVLAGVIGGLVAQHARGGMSLFDAARFGVEAHARAGEAWASAHAAQAGLLAAELADEIPRQLEAFRPGG